MKPPYTKWINDIKAKLGFTRTMTASGEDVVDAVNKQAQQIVNIGVGLATPTVTGTTNNTGATIDKGTYFRLDGVLCVALADIANGATFTSGTNYRAITEGGLNALYNKMPKGYGTLVNFPSGEDFFAPSDGIFISSAAANSVITVWSNTLNGGYVVTGGTNANSMCIPVFKGMHIGIVVSTGSGYGYFYPYTY